jgi:DNA polymerase-3 subunit epsilon
MLSDHQLAAIRAYRRLALPAADQSLANMRFVVVDIESSGLDPYRDRLLSIGAVTVTEGRIDLGQAFEILVRQAAPSDPRNILVHGIDGTTQLSGCEATEALVRFLHYVGATPLVGYHVDFDRIMIERAMQRSLRVKPVNDWLDVGRLLSALFPQHAAAGRGLDYWTTTLSVENFARHAAWADALATAQLLQIALAKAESQGATRYGDLRAIDRDQRWLSVPHLRH